mmetsp:Transcript_47539/g.92812  ORF Transcript_47539/g.92812 Transcript_47539/m.92812 type:complete len:223 (-) Transcript_47539:1435-2103(-)
MGYCATFGGPSTSPSGTSVHTALSSGELGKLDWNGTAFSSGSATLIACIRSVINTKDSGGKRAYIPASSFGSAVSIATEMSTIDNSEAGGKRASLTLGAENSSTASISSSTSSVAEGRGMRAATSTVVLGADGGKTATLPSPSPGRGTATASSSSAKSYSSGGPSDDTGELSRRITIRRTRTPVPCSIRSRTSVSRGRTFVTRTSAMPPVRRRRILSPTSLS